MDKENLTKGKQKENVQKNLVDLSYIRELLEGNEQMMENVIALFLQQIPDELTLLEKAIEEQDYKVIKTISHKFKSSVNIFGINVLIPVVALMEEKGEQQKDLHEIKESFLCLKEILNKAIDELKQAIGCL